MDTGETHHYGILDVFPNVLDFLFLFSVWSTTQEAVTKANGNTSMAKKLRKT